MKKIVTIATLDTKGEEVGYLKELISKRGHKPLIIDVSSRGEARIPADITSSEVATAGMQHLVWQEVVIMKGVAHE